MLNHNFEARYKMGFYFDNTYGDIKIVDDFGDLVDTNRQTMDAHLAAQRGCEAELLNWAYGHIAVTIARHRLPN